MKIGVVGALGVVGSACVYGFEVLGHTVLKHDLRLNTKIEDILLADTIYICVPTPSNPETGQCDTSIVEAVVEDILSKNYSGIVAIKSTITPGTTQRLIDKYSNYNICFCPEILKERSAISDFQNQDVCVIGTRHSDVFEIIKTQHGRYARQTVQLTPTEAELFKYMNNNFNSMLVTFANSFYEVCRSVGADYSKVKDALVKRDHISDMYLDCNDNLRGFAGVCLIKDCKAMAHLCEESGNGVEFFKNLLLENDKYRKTVFDGMRLE